MQFRPNFFGGDITHMRMRRAPAVLERARLTAARACLAFGLATGALALGGCATGSYAGVPLAPGAAQADVQQLARRARSGDKQAQLELGIRYEEGRGVAADLERAKMLYQAAAGSSGGTHLAYSPGSRGGPGQWIPISSGRTSPGLPEAYLRLLALDRKRVERRVAAELTAGPVSSPEVCRNLGRALEILSGAPATECKAYPFEVRPKGGRRFVAYDLVVSISFEDLVRRDYPTNLVDPPEMSLIEASAPVAGTLAYLLVPGVGGPVAIIQQFEPR